MTLATVFALAFSVHGGTGLTLETSGVPVVRSSWFQYYEPGWSKGYYSSIYNDQKIDCFVSGVKKISFRSNDGRASGTIFYTPSPSNLRVDYEFNWGGDHPILVEVTAGAIWAPAIQLGRLTVDR